MIGIIDALHNIFTNVHLEELLDDPYNIGTPGVGVTAGVTVFAGLDRAAADMSDSKYPYLIIEPESQQQSYDGQGKEISTVNIGFAVLVPGQQGALIGRHDTGQRGILDWMEVIKNVILENKRLKYNNKYITCKILNIATSQFMSSDDTGVIFSRGFEMQIIYGGINWTGQ